MLDFTVHCNISIRFNDWLDLIDSTIDEYDPEAMLAHIALLQEPAAR